MVPDYVPGDPYGVRVALMTNGFYSLFGDVCEIVAPGAARMTDTVKPVEFTAVAYPNPFADSFNISSSAINANQVKVYDLTGRLLDAMTVEASKMEQIQLGQKYPAGVYNVIISTGDEVRTLRVIKR